MTRIMFRDAIKQAIREEMIRDQSVFIIGEDMHRIGGGFSVLAGLYEEFGDERVIDTPISESLIAGASAGAATMGLKPVAEIMFSDFLTICMDEIVNYAAKYRYLHGGKVGCPLVIRAPIGAGLHYGMAHQQSFEAWFIHVPGLKVVVPSTPYDAKGLLKAAIRDPEPVLFFEHKLLYSLEGEVPDGDYVIPIGQADVKRTGEDVTVITYAAMVQTALKAADKLEREGISMEVIDLRSLSPMDKKIIIDSVQKTGKAIVAYEACRTGGVGAEVSAILAEEVFWSLEAPIVRVTSPDTPVTYSPIMEDFYIPKVDDFIAAARKVLA